MRLLAQIHATGRPRSLQVGAATETELKDKKLRYEDALNSVKAAMNEGVVPGGGATLVYCMRFKDKVLAGIEDEDEKTAVEILFRAIGYPIQQIAENAGVDGRCEPPPRRTALSAPKLLSPLNLKAAQPPFNLPCSASPVLSSRR